MAAHSGQKAILAALVAAIGMLLAFEMKGLLIGESASPKETDAIDEVLRSSPHVRRLIEVRTQHLGPDELLVAAKVELDDPLSFDDVADAIDGAEARLRQRVPSAVHLSIEPDLHGARSPAAATRPEAAPSDPSPSA